MKANSKTAIVMEMSGARAVVMTKDGQFQRIRVSPSAKVGDVVSTQSLFQQASRLRFRSAIAGVAAAAVIITGLLHAVLVAPPQAEASAFVSLDMTPSISLELSDQMTVLGVQGTNPAGVKLARTLHIKGTNLNAAVDEIIEQISHDGKLTDGNTIVVAAASSKGNSSNVQTMATNAVNDALRLHVNSNNMAQVYSMGVPDSVWQDALKADVSPGIYATYLLANQAGLTVPLKDISSSNFQAVLGQVHDLESGTSQLNTGNFNDVAGIVQSQTK